MDRRAGHGLKRETMSEDVKELQEQIGKLKSELSEKKDEIFFLKRIIQEHRDQFKKYKELMERL